MCPSLPSFGTFLNSRPYPKAAASSLSTDLEVGGVASFLSHFKYESSSWIQGFLQTEILPASPCCLLLLLLLFFIVFALQGFTSALLTPLYSHHRLFPLQVPQIFVSWECFHVAPGCTRPAVCAVLLFCLLAGLLMPSRWFWCQNGARVSRVSLPFWGKLPPLMGFPRSSAVWPHPALKWGLCAARWDLTVGVEQVG